MGIYHRNWGESAMYTFQYTFPRIGRVEASFRIRIKLWLSGKTD